MARRMNRAVALVLGSVILAMPTAAPVWAGAPAAIRFDIASDWAEKVWKAAAANDRATLDELLANRPEGVDADGRLTKSVELLKASFDAREAKRAESVKRASRQLDRALAEADKGGLAISQALKFGVELHMLSTDKAALMREERLQSLVRKADAAARAAEAAGDWLTASELFYRLDLLLEDKATYKPDVKRETQRLSMIRMYAPKRMWELRNERRNAELAWEASHKDDEAEPADGDSGARQRERRPLPPYNPKGDSYEQKLDGISERMIQDAVIRAMDRHVERVGWGASLRSGLEAIRTMVQTADLRGSFPGLNDETARNAFVKFLDEEDQKLTDAGEKAGPADLTDLLNRLPRVNDRTVKLPRTALLHELGNGIFAALDEYSGVIWPDEIRRFNRNTQARFKGVGVQIELDPMSNIRVVTPLDGTPAQRAGIRAGDLIKKVDGDSTEGFSLDQAVDVITGPGDTMVTLTVEREVTQPDGTKKVEEKDFPLVRKDVPIITVKGWKRSGIREDDWDWFIDPQDRIGYVRLLQFSDNTDERFDRAISQMKTQGLNGLILDLRYNPGGLLDQAVAITSRFVDGNTPNHNAMVVTTHNKENKIVQRERMLRGKATLAGIPVVVLINEGSASASEIVSGAIQDYAQRGDVKAVLLGARSYGKGSVQNVWGLAAGNAESAVKVTTQYYHLPADRMIHRLPGSTEWGVNPDLPVEMLPSQLYDALTLRQNADVLRLDEQGNPDASDRPANPDDLITKGMDVQLHQALVLLQAQAAAKPQGQAMIEKPTKTP
jgi:carboxyl-terminal processing protease